MTMLRLVRSRCQAQCQQLIKPAARRHFIVRSRRRPRSGFGVIENYDVQRMRQQSNEYHRYRMAFLRAGAIAGLISIAYTSWKLKKVLEEKNATKLDSPLPTSDPTSGGEINRKVIILDEDGVEKVPTGNSTVPEFPRIVHLDDKAASSTATVGVRGVATPAETLNLGLTEYTLVGLGLRTVTFLRYQVYVVGFYVATADVAALQASLVKKINPIATTLVPGEREELREQLLDVVQGEDTWNGLLKDGVPARSLFRIVPVRDTDFHHLRDGFVRAIQARSDKLTADPGVNRSAGKPTDIGESVRDFRALFSGGSVPKRKEMLLVRDANGDLKIFYDDGAEGADGKPLGRRMLGQVLDERISRALWMNYLAGKKVASEPARRNIIEGVMEFVERPVGTVATQVVAVVP